MFRRTLVAAAVAALAAGVSAYAANPFSDVSTSDWLTRRYPSCPTRAS